MTVVRRWDGNHLHLHLEDAFIQSDYNKYIFQKKEKQQYNTVGTVRTFKEPRAKH